VTAAAASQHPPGAAQAPAGIPVTEVNAESSATAAQIIQ
jgi:hypothetical protein